MTEKGSYELRYADKLRNCEDLVVDEKVGYMVLGCDEGRDVWNTVMVSSSSYQLCQMSLIHHPRVSLESLRLKTVHSTSTTTPAPARLWKPYVCSTLLQTTLSTLLACLSISPPTLY